MISFLWRDNAFYYIVDSAVVVVVVFAVVVSLIIPERFETDWIRNPSIFFLLYRMLPTREWCLPAPLNWIIHRLGIIRMLFAEYWWLPANAVLSRLFSLLFGADPRWYALDGLLPLSDSS